jgi:transcriptional regulator with XRE-family HTH domain
MSNQNPKSSAHKVSEALKVQARELRINERLSFGEIAKRLGISKSTVRRSCEGVELDEPINRMPTTRSAYTDDEIKLIQECVEQAGSWRKAHQLLNGRVRTQNGNPIEITQIKRIIERAKTL